MKLKVKFVGGSSNYAISFEERLVGLNKVEAVREELGLRLPLNLFNSAIWKFQKDPEITIPEELAVESGHFGETPSIEVEVPPKYLNDYTSEENEIERDADGRVIFVGYYHEITEENILRAWEYAGFPLKWGFEEEEEEDE